MAEIFYEMWHLLYEMISKGRDNMIFVPISSSGAKYGTLDSKEWQFTGVKSHRNDRKVPFLAPEDSIGKNRR